MSRLIKADFHVHSIASWDSLSKGEYLYRRAKEIGLGKLIFTDHNSIAEGLRMQKMYPEFVIVGEEILTTKAEILAIIDKYGYQPNLIASQLKSNKPFVIGVLLPYLETGDDYYRAL